MSAPDRGRCGGCGVVYTITVKGLVRSHISWGEGSHPVSGKCVGSGMPPIGADEPVLYTEVRELRREIAQLRETLAATRHEADAWKARCEASDHLLSVNEHLHAALTAGLKVMRRSCEEGDRRFDAEMAALREKHPTVRRP